MATLWVLLACLGTVSGVVGGVSVMSSSSPDTPTPPYYLPPANTTSQTPSVLKREGGANPTLQKGEEGMNTDDEIEIAEDTTGAEVLETAYEQEDSTYELLPVPQAQDGSNEGSVRYDSTYIVTDKDGVGCIMAYFKAKVTIYYADALGDFRTIKVSPPADDEVDISGSCDRMGMESQLDVAWDPSYVLTLKFGLDDRADTWFVSRFSLTYNTNDKEFQGAAPGGGKVTVSSSDGRKYWQTSNRYSFRCLLLHDVALSDAVNNTATLHFDEVRVQAFCDESIFRRPKHCIHRVHRNEMVPVTVGGALAGSTLLTVLAYGIFRYFKVKKVQYDTMQ